MTWAAEVFCEDILSKPGSIRQLFLLGLELFWSSCDLTNWPIFKRSEELFMLLSLFGGLYESQKLNSKEKKHFCKVMDCFVAF
jgi:hypothetical protein